MVAVVERPSVKRNPIKVAVMGTLPTLPSGFSGWSLDAQNGLSLYMGGVLQARYGSAGGAGVLKEHGGYQSVDASHNARLRFEYPANAVNQILKASLSFSLQPFRSGQQSTAASSTSGASSATSSNGTSILHHHDTTYLGGNTGSTLQADATGNPFNSSGSNITVHSSSTDVNHTHDIPHTHTIPSLSLNNPSGLYETGCARGAHVFVDGTDRTTALGGPWGVGSALDVSDLDISQWITSSGWHEVMVTSTTIGGVIPEVTSKVLLKTV